MWPPTDAVDTPEPFAIKETAEQEVIRDGNELFLVKDE